MTVWDWFAGLFTVGGMAYFLTGFASAFIIYYLVCRHAHRKAIINWRYAGIAIGTVAIIFVSMQTQTAYNLAQQTARDVQDCQRQFNQAIREARKISEENDALSIAQRDLFAEKDRAETHMWVDLLAPPGEIAGLPTSNPRRQQYGLEVVGAYSRHANEIDVKIKAIQDRQNQLKEDRRTHAALPEPTCGK